MSFLEKKMARLWQKNYDLDSLMQQFTVRNDYILDRQLVISDLMGSVAHARTLNRAGVLSDKELEDLEKGLNEIASLQIAGRFEIKAEDEDCHTAIEGYLTKNYGQTGKKIHTGRSRNDQVQTALRVYMREAGLKIALEALDFASALLDSARKYEYVPMPGRTHTQLAMPSSLGLWFDSFACEIADEVRLLTDVLKVLDQCPLGSAASYGVPLPLEREFSASQLGFSRVQRNVLYANNSRGKFESMILDSCDYLCSTCAKMAQDLILFTLPELGYFSLPVQLTTGSSIMPQKKNPDGLELVRSRSSVVSSMAGEVKNITRTLVSGYNRDFQDTKEPLLTGLRLTFDILAIMSRMVSGLIVHEDRLLAGFRNEIFATDKVFEAVKAGRAFRDSYREVGLNLDSVSAEDASQAIMARTSTGTSGNLKLEESRAAVSALEKECSGWMERLMAVYRGLIKESVTAVSW